MCYELDRPSRHWAYSWYESLFVFIHECGTFIPCCTIHFLGTFVVEHIIIVFYEGNDFFMRLGVVEKAHWYGANRWSKNIFKVSFDFLFLDFLALTMFTNICTTKFILDHFWNITMGPQTTHTMLDACFIFHGWKCYYWSIECFACDGDIK
jgi:hypothetical protein